LENVIDELTQATALIPDPSIRRLNRTTELERLFAQSLPPLSADPLLHPEVVSRMSEALRVALQKIEDLRKVTVAAVQELQASVSSVKTDWAEKRQAHDDNLRAKLRAAGVESPQEIIDRVGVLRSQINTIKTNRRPRLTEVCSLIDQHETARAGYLLQLENCNSEITAKRKAKAAELTKAVGEQIKISISANADTTEYKRVLDELCSEIVTKESRIQNREGQLQRVAAKLSPVRFARCLKQKGTVRLEDGSEVSLQDLCGITENTENFLCRIADDVQRLNKLETVETADVPEILVKRRGENAFADLRTGLSPGEQSAAILTLALQTRSMPLILDQPEDELGYNYVVHLIVPKILDAKFSRQLLVVTHNANIPVLGDADYVTKMENRPHPATGRMCVVAGCGCFESSEITKALVELEGGRRAFEFRQHRYAMPSYSEVAKNENA
jgi:hypothetical protein